MLVMRVGDHVLVCIVMVVAILLVDAMLRQMVWLMVDFIMLCRMSNWEVRVIWVHRLMVVTILVMRVGLYTMVNCMCDGFVFMSSCWSRTCLLRIDIDNCGRNGHFWSLFRFCWLLSYLLLSCFFSRLSFFLRQGFAPVILMVIPVMVK